MWDFTGCFWLYNINDIVLCCRYLAAKSEADHYVKELKREEEEIISVPDTGN